MRKTLVLFLLFSKITLFAQSALEEICLSDIIPGDSYEYAKNNLKRFGFKEKYSEEKRGFFDEKYHASARIFTNSSEKRKNYEVAIKYDGYPDGALGGTVNIIEWSLTLDKDDNYDDLPSTLFFIALNSELEDNYKT